MQSLFTDSSQPIRRSSRGYSHRKHVFSGVRPSSGAETLENDAAFEMSDTLESAEVAAAGDGRTPVNRYHQNDANKEEAKSNRHEVRGANEVTLCKFGCQFRSFALSLESSRLGC